MHWPNVFALERRYYPLLAIVIVFLLAKVLFSAITIVAADEAYYWVWGQQFALSYFDHPPLNAWIIGLTSQLFGNNVLGMRIPTFISFVGILYVYWLFAQRLFPERATVSFLIMIAAFLASPTLFAWTSIVYNDHLLIFLGLAAAYAFSDYFSAFAKDKDTSVAPLYLAALMLGLAALAKYNAAFIGVGIAMLVIGHPKLRALLQRPHIYLAGILCLAMLSPVLIWNIQNGFASFELHLVDRFEQPLFSTFNTVTFTRFVLSTLIYFGPVLFIPLLMIFRPQKPLNEFGQQAIWIARLTIALSFITFLALATRGTVHWYWSSIAYALMLPFLPMLVRNVWLLAIHFMLGAVFIVYATFNYSYAPIEMVMGGQSPEVARVYGWSEFGSEIKRLKAEYPDAAIATTHYSTAGQLAHELNRTDIYDLSPRPTHFTFIDRKNLEIGERAIVLHDQFGDLEETAARFKTFTQLTSVEFKRDDILINKVDIYLGEDFIR
ncbi:ArnT family glycosyltransferase [Maritalea sp.]|uniref:ArnT family glycosyltransferase n=1 Tax=Maritalea sp. TaxID=2003361 RepID=UPI003EF95679